MNFMCLTHIKGIGKSGQTATKTNKAQLRSQFLGFKVSCLQYQVPVMCIGRHQHFQEYL